MIKAAFFDIDGTLVSFKTHRIPQSALQSVSRLRQLGVKVFIATGRPMPFVDNLEDLEYDGIMCVNGAHCQEADGRIVYSSLIDKADLQRIIAYCQQHPLPIVFASATEVFSVHCEEAVHSVREVFQLLNLTLPPTRPIEDALSMDILQVIAFFSKEEEPHIMGEILRGCDAFRWHPAFADCIVRGTNKAVGIQRVCQHYGFDISQTIAFGDGGNDIQMLQQVGIGVAMGNAPDDVKAYADFVTTSVDEDGIANALNQLAFNQQ